MAIPTPKSTPASTRFEPFSTKAKVSPATIIATKDSPRAIVLVNACCRTLTAFSQKDWPLTCKNAAYARSETDFFRQAFFIGVEFLSDDASRAPHRDSKAMARLGGGSPQLQLSAPYAHRPAQPSPARGYLSPHEYAQSPVAESRMLSASSDQPCCHHFLTVRHNIRTRIRIRLWKSAMISGGSPLRYKTFLLTVLRAPSGNAQLLMLQVNFSPSVMLAGSMTRMPVYRNRISGRMYAGASGSKVWSAQVSRREMGCTMPSSRIWPRKQKKSTRGKGRNLSHCLPLAEELHE
jgi:hypothetical protein